MPQASNPAAVTRTAELPIGSLQMEVRNFRRDDPPADAAAGGDAPAARFELVFTTGAPVRRYDWSNGRYYLETLVVEGGAINLARLERGAPLLNTHWAYSLEDQIGVCEQPAIEGGVGTVQAQLSRRESVRGIVQDLEDRVIRNVSVGYGRDAIEMVAPSDENGMWVYRVTRWTPMEVSLVPIPADMDAQVRSADGRLQADPEQRTLRMHPCVMTEVRAASGATTTTEQHAAALAAAASETPAAGAQAETSRNSQGATMTTTAQQQTNGGGASAATTPDDATRAATEAARQAGATAERERQAGIRAAADAARGTLGDDAHALATRLIDAGVGVDEARRQMLDALAERSNATASRGQSGVSVSTVQDNVDVQRARMSDAIILRANPGATAVAGQTIDREAARNFRGMDLVDMARASIRAAGGNPDGLTRREIALAALNLDADARRSAGMHSTSDFPNILASTVNRTLRSAYQLAPRTFTGWARRSSVKDFREKAVNQLSELSSFLAVKQGGEYKQLTFGDSAEKYSLSKYGGIIAITWEAIVNDDMSAFDRLPMMVAEEAAATESDIVYGILSANAALADTGTLFNTTARTTAGGHANQAGSGGAISVATLGAGRAAMRKQVGPKGRVLNLAPDFLICGPDKEAEANQYTSTAFVAAAASSINPAFNTSLTVVVDARVSGNKWYLAATPTRVDTIEYAYLEGEEGLYTERKDGFEVDGVLIKARTAFAAKAIDFVGLYYNPGA